MFFPLNSVLFFFTLILGLILSISSNSWLTVWIGLELNLLSFIPIIAKSNNKYLSEAAIKYFLIQATASSIIMVSGPMQFMNNQMPEIMLMLSFTMKLGAAPFHFWLPQIMEGMTWPQISVMLTLQKVAPLYLISYLNFEMKNMIITLTALLSAIMGAINGFNMTSLKKILAFSSINHMAWMLMSIFINETMWQMYFLIYSIISLSIVFMFNIYKTSNLSDLAMMKFKNTKTMILFSFCLLSLGGLPPFLGFLPKWFIMQTMIMSDMYLTLVIMLITSLITLFFYLRISMFLLLFSLPKMKTNIKNNMKKFDFFSYLLIFTNSFSIFVPMLFSII